MSLEVWVVLKMEEQDVFRSEKLGGCFPTVSLFCGVPRHLLYSLMTCVIH